jgi:hypothetical protein
VSFTLNRFLIGFGGDHSGSTMIGNSVTARQDTLGIGLMAGHHPWDPSVDVSDAGQVREIGGEAGRDPL